MFSHMVLFDMHTNFFPKAVESITDDDTHNRLNTKANHMAWLAGSFVEQRYELARGLGINKNAGAHELFANNKGIQEGITYPTLKVFQRDLEEITPVLKERLLTVTDDKLDEKFEMMPGMKISYFDWYSFAIYREANIIGQLALWRRLLGYPALNYM
jgi:hypothetical protein